MDVALYISKCSDLKNAVLIQVVAKEFLFLCLIKYDKTQSHRLGATGAGRPGRHTAGSHRPGVWDSPPDSWHLSSLW